MRRFIFSFFLLGGLSFALLAALPVWAQKEKINEPSTTQEEKVRDIVVNKQPLRDFAANVSRLDETNRVDWTKPFFVEVEGALAKNGRLEKAVVAKTEGDAELISVGKQGILALGDSGWLGYLRNQGVEKVKISAAQDSENFSFTIVSELATLERANTVSSGLSAIVHAALLLDKNGIKKLGDDEKTLLTSANVTASEKTVNISFVMPAGEFREMIRRRKVESKEKANG